MWSNGKTVLARVFRGRFVEGADLTNELPRAVIICGVPFAKLRDPFVQPKYSYYNQQKDGSWWE